MPLVPAVGTLAEAHHISCAIRRPLDASFLSKNSTNLAGWSCERAADPADARKGESKCCTHSPRFSMRSRVSAWSCDRDETRLTQMKRLRSAVLMTTPLSISPEMPLASSSNWLLKPLGAVLLSWSSPPAALSPGSLTWRKELMIACETVNCNGQQFEAIAFYSSSPQRILHCNKPANCFPFACLQSRRGVQRAAWPSAGRQSPECDHA